MENSKLKNIMNLTNDKQEKKFWFVRIKVIYECDGCPYDEKNMFDDTYAVSKAKAESNICWRYLKRQHTGGCVDYHPYSDKYSEQWYFEAEEFYTTVIDNRKEREELDYEF